MKIRHATLEDLKQITAVEAVCFPEAEQIIGFVNGMVTDESDLTDAMYECADMHSEQGDWQMIFGVNTLPEFRCQGYAERILTQGYRILGEEL